MKLNKKQKRTATIASMADLLAVVLGMGGQTYANYVSTTKAETATATVAKWGLSATISAGEMFGNTYLNGASSVKAAANAEKNTVSVYAENKVIAPGTKGSVTVTFGGMAEVDATVKVNADKVVLPYVSYGGNTYYPIKWSIGTTPVTPDSKGNVTANELSNAINKLSATYEANGNDSNAYDVASYTINWEWSFEGNDEGDTHLAILSTKGSTNESGVTSYTDTATSTLYQGVVGIELGLSVTFEQED